jgi:hypothetical protein
VLGGDFVDTDPTNDFPFSPAPVPDGVADVIPISKGMASVAVAELLANDVDFYALHLFAGQVLSAMTAPLADLDATFDAPDTRIALFGGTPSGIHGYPYLEKFVENEDAGNFEESDLYPDLGSDNPFEPFGVFGSAIRALIPEDGVYYLAVSGFGDSDYSGSHDDEGRYALLVGVVLPEPGTLLLALIGAVGLCLTGRRMSRPEGAKACSQGR